MALTFEWDPDKAQANLAKHGVGFLEAATLLGDSLSLTISDPGHSEGEQRFVSVGFASFRPAAQRGESNVPMSKKPEKKDAVNELRAEYDFSEGQRGKYAARFKEGTRVVVLEPDVAAVFPTSEAVNAALRKVAGLEDA